MRRRNIKIALAAAGAIVASTVVTTTSAPVLADGSVTTDVTCVTETTSPGAANDPLPAPIAFAGSGTSPGVLIPMTAPTVLNQGDTFNVTVDPIVGIVGVVPLDPNVNSIHTTLNLTNTTTGSSTTITNPGAQFLGTEVPPFFTYPSQAHNGLQVDPAATGDVVVELTEWVVYKFDVPAFLTTCTPATPLTVNIPVNLGPTAPIAADDSGPTIFAGDPAVSFNILQNDSDPNDPAGTFGCDPASTINEASVAIDDTGTAGAVSWDPIACQITYDGSGLTGAVNDTFTYTVADDGGLTSNVATVTVPVQAAGCVAPCSLSQTLTQEVIAGNLSMTQAGATVPMSDVTLDGAANTSTGAINQIVVSDNRGDPAAGWSLSMELTGNITRAGGLVPSDIIPAANLASTTNTCVATSGGGAIVQAGTPADFSSSQTLCSTPDAALSGGTFTADADLELIVPATANAGTYQGTLQFSLS